MRLPKLIHRLAAQLAIALLLGVHPAAPGWAADAGPNPNDSLQVLQAFEKTQPAQAPDETQRTRHKVMFLLGVPLLILLLITGTLGLATGLYGKQLFVLHMLFAGLSVTLAIVHAIVGLVWFFPF